MEKVGGVPDRDDSTSSIKLKTWSTPKPTRKLGLELGRKWTMLFVWSVTLCGPAILLRQGCLGPETISPLSASYCPAHGVQSLAPASSSSPLQGRGKKAPLVAAILSREGG